MKHLAVLLLSIFVGTSASSQSIHDAWNTLLQKNVSKDGHVDYSGFNSSIGEVEKYILTLEANVPELSDDRNKYMAFWINAYNVTALYYVLDNTLLKSINEKGEPWDKPLFNLKGKKVSLNHIEHEILRPLGDARIHFAVNCASYSCPRLLNRAFYGKNLEMDLEYLTKDFLQDGRKNIFHGEGAVSVSKIFEWFADDFIYSAGSVRGFLEKYGPEKEVLNIKFKNYIWDLNGSW